MRHWNRLPHRVRSRNTQLLDHRFEALVCQICQAPLPKGLQRVFCLKHSDYPRRLQAALAGGTGSRPETFE